MSPFRLVPLALAVILTLVATSASAARRQSPPEPVPASVLDNPVIVGTPTTLSICELGINGPPSPNGPENVVYYNGQDHYLTYLNLNSTTCATCTTFTQAKIEAANLALYIKAAPCTVVVEVSMVRAFPPPCQIPDRYTEYCTPFLATLVAPDPEALTYFRIPFPEGHCAIQSPSFVEMTFMSWSAGGADTTLKPRIMPQTAGTQCVSYNAIEDERSGDDFVFLFTAGNPIMWVEVLECESTAARRRTWGELKTLYR